jgi:hypothetical protein
MYRDFYKVVYESRYHHRLFSIIPRCTAECCLSPDDLAVYRYLIFRALSVVPPRKRLTKIGGQYIEFVSFTVVMV